MEPVLPTFRLVLAITAALALVALGVGLYSAPRSTSVFAIELRSAQGSPIERSLPEPPDWKQFVALAAKRRSQELDRLLDLPVAPPAAPDPAPESALQIERIGPSPEMPETPVTETVPQLAGLADRAPQAHPDTSRGRDVTGSIDHQGEHAALLVLPDFPEIPAIVLSLRQAPASRAPEPQAGGNAVSEAPPRVAAAPAAEPVTDSAAPAVALPARVRLPPVKPPQAAARKKPRVARPKTAARQPAAPAPVPNDPFAAMFGPPPR